MEYIKRLEKLVADLERQEAGARKSQAETADDTESTMHAGVALGLWFAISALKAEIYVEGGSREV